MRINSYCVLSTSTLLFFVFFMLIDIPHVNAQNEKYVATCLKIDGSLQHKSAGKWVPVKVREKIPANSLLVGLPKAKLLSRNKKVVLDLLADIGKRGPFPVLEPAVILHDNNKVDLDFTLDRGVVSITNLKVRGTSKVQVRFIDKVWNMTLNKPGTLVFMEIFGRHTPGEAMFSSKLKESDKVIEVPNFDVVLLVAKGSIQLETDTEIRTLTAPPGPSRLIWDNIFGLHKVERLETLPKAALRLPDKEEIQKALRICGCTSRFNDEPVDEVLKSMVNEDSEERRKVGVICMGALDRPAMLLDALRNEKHADVRETAIVALRHWMGRKAGQTQKLYDTMRKEKDYPKIRARILIGLLDGFSDADLERPFTYELLILFLEGKDLAVRHLAWWHLQRLARVGEINYNPAGSEESRRAAIAEIRKVIPQGKLPKIK